MDAKCLIKNFMEALKPVKKLKVLNILWQSMKKIWNIKSFTIQYNLMNWINVNAISYNSSLDWPNIGIQCANLDQFPLISDENVFSCTDLILIIGKFLPETSFKTAQNWYATSEILIQNDRRIPNHAEMRVSSQKIKNN